VKKNFPSYGAAEAAPFQVATSDRENAKGCGFRFQRTFVELAFVFN